MFLLTTSVFVNLAKIRLNGSHNCLASEGLSFQTSLVFIARKSNNVISNNWRFSEVSAVFTTLVVSLFGFLPLLPFVSICGISTGISSGWGIISRSLVCRISTFSELVSLLPPLSFVLVEVLEFVLLRFL